FDRLSTDKYQIYNIDAVRTPKTNENSLPRREVRLSALSTNAQVCVRRIKSQVAKRLPTLTAESVVILLLDPRTKFTVSDLVRPVKFAEAGIAGPSTDTGDVGAAAIDAVIEDAGLSTDAGDVDAAAIDTVIEDGKTILRNAHREVYCSMQANDLSGAQIKDLGMPPNLDLDMPPNLDSVPSVHDELVMCGAPVPTQAPPENPMAILHDQADIVLDKWYQYTVQWVRVAVQQAPDEMLSTEDFTPKHVDICRWYRDAGSKLFPSIAALVRVWLGRSPSNAFHERVFSTGAFVMNSLRTSTDNMRAEM
ncbi:hypothetical protein GN958_ATG18774, partial [Phytophthora infestans]